MMKSIVSSLFMAASLGAGQSTLTGHYGFAENEENSSPSELDYFLDLAQVGARNCRLTFPRLS